VCGIGGAVGVRGEAEARRLAAALVGRMGHRGPDSSGEHLEPLAGGGFLSLAHTRLSIIDLTDAASQPMTDPDTGNVIVYNGEVYDFRDLRRGLEAEGVRFRSSSDTEVVIRGYARWGRGVLDRLRGMFAFAVWDAGRRELFCARDRFGIKPLYHCRGPGGEFCFCSEIRPLVATGMAGRTLDPDGLRSYLAFGSVQAPWTMLEGVRSLMPGEWLAVRDGRVSRGRYGGPLARPGPERHPETERTAVDRVASVLRESVALHLVADVPVGVFLSGGIDSSVVTALATEASAGVETFSLVFPGPSTRRPSTRAPWPVATRRSTARSSSASRISLGCSPTPSRPTISRPATG
jgi:asparagine synthase (glutamine-hydrolysing)